MSNPILGTAIGLFFVYLLLSMICSAVLEWIAALLGLRAKTLAEGLSNMLCCDQYLVAEIYKHPLVKGLSRKSFWDRLTRKEPRPSYISGDVFAKALLSVVGLDSTTLATPTTADNGRPLSTDTRTMLESFRVYAKSDINALRKNVEDWYNDAMDRVSGWYKRKTYGITLVIALIVAAFANADSIMLVRVFWHDPTIRAAAAAAATDWVKSHQAQDEHATQKNLDAAYPSTSDDQPVPPPSPEAKFQAVSENLSSTLTEVQGQLERAKIPLGWCSESARKGLQKDAAASYSACDPQQQFPAGRWDWFYKACGLLITMVALSQGAPFWFDLLQKLVNVRLAGTAPDEKPKK